ncbi:MAG: hypothetical protein ABIP49_04620 [Lysobacterales bacterium]
MNSVFRLLAGVTVLLGLALASAPSQAISVVGNLGWQPVPAACVEATNVRFNIADRKLRFSCGTAAVQFTCTPAGNVVFATANQRVSVACASNTVTAVTSTRMDAPEGATLTCNMNNFDFNATERTVSFTCTNSPSIPHWCYAASLPPAINYETGTVDLGYCPDAVNELVGHSGFEEGELWRPTFGQSP